MIIHCLCVMLHKLKVSSLRANDSYFILARGHDLSKAALYTLMDVSANDKLICRSCAGKNAFFMTSATRVLFLYARDKRDPPVFFFLSFLLRRNVFK